MKNPKAQPNSARARLIWCIIVIAVLAGLIYFLFFRQSDSSDSEQANNAQSQGNSAQSQERGKRGGRAGSGKYVRPSAAVQVAAATRANVPVQVKALGTVSANQTVTVTSRIAGQLESVRFAEGQWVEKGQLLATIDTRTYEASKAQYQGQLKQDRAQLKNAESTLARYRELFAQDSLARQDLDTQIATVSQYQGAIASDLAQIRSAQVDIDYGRITAPVSGYVGLRLTDVGNTVSADSTSIVTITQTRPIAVTFSIPEQYLAQVRPVIRSGKTLPVSVLGSDGTTVMATGHVQYLSNQIDTSTGSIELKALFENKDEDLFPNQYVNVVLQIDMLKDVVVAPEAAIQLSDAGNFVYVVDDGNIVHKTMITKGPTTAGNNVAVTKGLKAGDRVIIRGVDNLTDGATVNPVGNEAAALSTEKAASQKGSSTSPDDSSTNDRDSTNSGRGTDDHDGSSDSSNGTR